jgi:hypothetical protein
MAYSNCAERHGSKGTIEIKIYQKHQKYGVKRKNVLQSLSFCLYFAK